MKKLKSYDIAISGISTALSTIFMVGMLFSPTLKLTFLVLSALSVSLPLTKNMWGGTIFAYIATSIIGFFVANISALPFIFFFGIYAIIQVALDTKFYYIKALPTWAVVSIIFALKICFYCLSFSMLYIFFKTMIADITLFGWDWSWWLLMLCGFFVFVLYDFIFRLLYKNLCKFTNNILKDRK